jgi:branched-chain amino acid transport system substrate-binding protein
MRKTAIVVTMGFVLPMALAGSAFAADETVKIGIGLPLTGQIGFLGQQFLKGAKVATEVVNENGGIGGRKLELVVRDHKGIPAEAVNVAKRLIYEDHVKVLNVDLPASATIAVEGVTKEAKIPQLGGYAFSSLTLQQNDPWYFQTSITSDTLAAAAAKMMHDAKGNETVAILAPNDDYGRGEVAAIKSALAEAGSPKVIYDDYYERTQTDYSPALLKMKSVNPNSLFLDVRFPDSVTVLKQLAEFGIKKPLFSTINFYNPKLVAQAGQYMEGTFIALNWAPELNDPASNAFKEVYQAKLKELPDANAELGWTSVSVIAAALKSAGADADAEAIRAALKKTDWLSPGGPIKFDEHNDAHVPAHILEFKDGKYHVIN